MTQLFKMESETDISDCPFDGEFVKMKSENDHQGGFQFRISNELHVYQHLVLPEGSSSKVAERSAARLVPVGVLPGLSHSAAPSKQDNVSYEQKLEISSLVNTLPESKMAMALNIILDNMPELKVQIPSPLARLRLQILVTMEM